MEKNERVFNVGEAVWFAQTGFQPIEEPCPVCFGHKAVVVVLGNGDEISLSCSYCGVAFMRPTGTTTTYRIAPGAKRVTITGREIREGEKTEITYHGHGGRYYYSHTLFETEAEALAASKELCEKELEDRETRAEWVKKDKIKSFAWNAGYHLRAAHKLRNDIAYHERMASVCKARAKVNVPAEEK